VRIAFAVKAYDRAGEQVLDKVYDSGVMAGEEYLVASRPAERITRVLRTRQARMARELVQRGLFDTRTERAAAARTSVVGTAVDACERQIDRLRRRKHLVPAGGELAFAVLSR
jgi:hypothetical protein